MTKPLNERQIVASLSLSPKSLDILDNQRGKESRSSFVNRLIREYGPVLE